MLPNDLEHDEAPVSHPTNDTEELDESSLEAVTGGAGTGVNLNPLYRGPNY